MNAVVAGPAPRYHRWPGVLASAAAVTLVAAAAGETVGWPFLAEPVSRVLTRALHRPVDFTVDGHTPASVRVRLLGRLRVEAPQIRIGAAGPATTAPTLQARDAVMSLSYADLWRARGGRTLHVQRIEAAELERPNIGVEVAQYGPCSSCLQARVDLTM